MSAIIVSTFCFLFIAFYELLNSQFHHRMNLPNSVVRHVLSTVALIFGSMAYIPERFADHCDDRRLTEGQFLRRASVKRKPCGSHFGWCDGLDCARICRRK